MTVPQQPDLVAPAHRPTRYQHEVSTLITPHNAGPASPDDEDPTGVRALLSGLPEPDPMPAYLVERIGASLAAEQAEREALSAGAPVIPMLATSRRRPGRILFAIAGAAAAVALIGTVGSSLLTTNPLTTASDSAASGVTSGSREASGATPPSTDDKGVAGGYAAPVSVQIRTSDTRYTAAGFVTQAGRLRDATFAQGQATAGASRLDDGVGTSAGLAGCLGALGLTGAQAVRADLALYDGRPALVIVATTGGIATAYAVRRECAPGDAALLHPATPLR